MNAEEQKESAADGEPAFTYGQVLWLSRAGQCVEVIYLRPASDLRGWHYVAQDGADEEIFEWHASLHTTRLAGLCAAKRHLQNLLARVERDITQEAAAIREAQTAKATAAGRKGKRP